MEPFRAEQSFTCTHCNRAFRRLEHLQRHTRTHTKEKPFTCHCGASFTRRDLLKRHSRIAHLPSPVQDSNTGDVGVVDASLGNIGSHVSLAQKSLPEGNHGETAMLEAPLIEQDCTKRPLSLPLPPEYRHVEEAFRDESSGNALHNLLQDLLEDAKPPAQPFQLHEVSSVAPRKEKLAFIQQTGIVDESSGRLHTDDMTLGEPWHDPSLRSTAAMRQKLVQALLHHGRTTELLPSAQSLLRYVRAFMDGFHERFSIFHTQTMPLAHIPADIGFSLLAVGADSCLESKAAMYLVESAAATSPALLGYGQFGTTAVFPTQEMTSAAATSVLSGGDVWLEESSHVLCVMLLLTVFGLENRSPRAMQVMWSVQGIFAHELRQSLGSLPGDPEDDTPDRPTSWPQWAMRESKRRIKHAAFCVLNIVSMSFDFPATVPFALLRGSVPCSAEEWRAPSADKWIEVRMKTRSKPNLLSSLVESLLAGGRDDASSSSVLGDFIILHAFLQRIRALRQALAVIPERILTDIESRLSSFVDFPSLSPNQKESGVYLLAGLAYLELHLDMPPFPTMSHNVTQLATWLEKFPLPARHPQWFPVLRGAIYMLDMQIARGLGVESHPFNIGVDLQSFLFVLRLPIFLIKWLLVMSGGVYENATTEDEQQIIQSAQDVVVEAGRCIDLGPPCRPRDPMSISTEISKMISHVCQRSPKEYVSLFGKAFGLYATMLEDGGNRLDPRHRPIVDHPADEDGGAIC